jgi:hypothetical protein
MTAIADPSTSRGFVSLQSLVMWTFVFIVWGILRQKFSGLAWSDALQTISILELAQVYFIWLMASRIDPGASVPPLVAVAALAIIATLVLTLRYRPSYASGGLELGLLALSAFYPTIRLVAWAITLFVFQYLFLAGPFLWLHEAVGSMDAAVLRSAMTELGYPAVGFGPFVYLNGSTHGVNVMGACSSSNIVGTILAGYCIIVMGRRGRLVPDDVSWIVGLLIASLVINWLRLAPMALSKEGHQFWHDGLGGSLVATLFAVLVVIAAALATRDADTVTA